jgi:sugar lactone lactonase YvrE
MAVDYSEFVTLPNSLNDALVFDNQGNLYASHSGKFTATGLMGTNVQKITPDGKVSDVATDFKGPLGHDFDSKGNMYVANYNDGTIDKVIPDGTKSLFTDLGKAGFASGILINSQDDIFVASYSGNAIYKVGPSGNAEVWVKDSNFNGPVGIATDEDGNIYIGNYEDGRTFKIQANKTVTELSVTPGGAGYITYAKGMIYTTGRSTHKIYQIPVSGGSAKELAGSATAGFKFPNGITASNDGAKLYVSNYQNNKIIVIENFQ